MRILIAPDKFKGSLSAAEVAENIAIGLREVLPNAQIELAPVADGGEGTADVICHARAGKWVMCDAHDALQTAISARYAWLRESRTAVIEMSEAAGSRRLSGSVRDVLHANTFGVGEMLLDAAKRDAHEIIVGLGGSATNDGGFGMARALEFRFIGVDHEHPPSWNFAMAGEQQLEHEFRDGPVDLLKLTRILSPVAAGVSPAKSMVMQPAGPPLQAKIIAAADVKNPLLGQRGATRVFGPQKGATPGQIEILELALMKLADVVARDLGCDFRNEPGAGAAGGLGFGLMTFCAAQLRSGFAVVADAIQLEEKISRADVVITGEGKLDAQTSGGKAPAGVLTLAHKHGKRIYAIVGQMDRDVNYSMLFDGIDELARSPISSTEAIKLTAELLRERAAELAGRIG